MPKAFSGSISGCIQGDTKRADHIFNLETHNTKKKNDKSLITSRDSEPQELSEDENVVWPRWKPNGFRLGRVLRVGQEGEPCCAFSPLHSFMGISMLFDAWILSNWDLLRNLYRAGRRPLEEESRRGVSKEEIPRCVTLAADIAQHR